MNINSEQYEKLLKKAPDHKSEEFLIFLKDNNIVVWETPEWLVIENIKYHNADKPWYTAFYKGPDYVVDYQYQLLNHEFPEWRFMINPVHARTVKRPHVHLFRVDTEYTIAPH